MYYIYCNLTLCRQQTSILAVRNARKKASEIGKLLHARVGKVIAIQELSTSEWEGSTSELPPDNDLDKVATQQQRIDMATMHSMAKVAVTFHLKVKHTKDKT